ncbi:SDR family NAD(P)-dependent oxidoreductase [Streptomyces sp. NPDC052042]|uniref:SDR family NAD(P)-dependent oxidoreductase n=1 Tax=Streptomyces sp. NPDC052042 TaxID=3365683 RepID=UPI0037D5CF33
MNEAATAARGRPVAMVTGGAGSFGSASCRRLAADGFAVAVSDRDLAAAERTAAGIDGAFAVGLDVTDADAVRAGVDAVLGCHGRLDVVVNNAGVAPPGTMSTTGLEAFDATLAINLRGAYLVTAAAMEALMDSPRARVVMIGSRTWLAGGNPAYSASKAGMVGLCRSVAQDLAPTGGTCNVVAPGPVDTGFVDAMDMGDTRRENFERYARMTPLGRVATPEDIASAVAFFASQEAGFITGETLNVAGGLQLAPKL